MRDDRERLQDVLEAIERIEKYAVVHEYFGIDHEIVWGVIEKDLPDLKQRVKGILEGRWAQ